MPQHLILDLIVAAAVVFAVVRGWRHRSVREAFSLLGMFVGIVAAVILVGPLSKLITIFSAVDVNGARLIALGTVVAVLALAGAILGIKTGKGVVIPGPRRFDAFGGALLAAMRSILVLTLMLYVLVAVSSRDAPRVVSVVDGSVSGRFLADPSAPFVIFYDSILTRSDDLQALTLWVRQRSDLQPTDPSDRLDFDGTNDRLILSRGDERRMLELINEERAERGLDPLAWCEHCAEVARLHSKDMYRNGYFSHVNLSGENPFERMQGARISYDSAGENLAIAPSVVDAHEGLMRSRDHRANILRAEFDEVGIGVFEGPYGLMCTQVFRRVLVAP